jgi:hypothetical protein
MEKSILENNVIREPLLTIKDWLMDADLDVSTTTVEMVSRTQTNNVILEPPTLTLLEMLAVPTAELLTVETVLSITEKLAIPSTILSVPPTVLSSPQLVVTEDSILENLVMLELTTLMPLPDADLIVPSPSVVMEFVTADLSQQLLEPSSTMKLVILLEEQPLVILEHVPTLVETETSIPTKSVISEVESELNPTTETSPTNAERDVLTTIVVMVSLTLMKSVILELPTD